MLVIIGYVVVMASVFGGFAMAGGHLAALLQPLELLMIGGAAVGAFFVGNDMQVDQGDAQGAAFAVQGLALHTRPCTWS